MSGDFVDYYQVLGVSVDATSEEIRAAYRQKAGRIHPDVNDRVDASAQQKRLNEAFEVLSNAEKRREYDATRRAYREANPSRDMTTPRRPQSSVPKPLPESVPQPTPVFELNPTPAAGPSMSFTKRLLPHAIWAIAALLLAAAAVTAFRRPPSKEEQIEKEEAKLDAAKRILDKKQELHELELAAARRSQESAIALARLKAVKSAGENVLSDLNALDAEIGKWESDVRPLLTNEEGKQIAANEESVRAFQSIWTAKRPTRYDAKAIRERVDVLLAPISKEMAKPQPLAVPDESVSALLKTEAKQVEEMIAAARGPRQQIGQLLSVAERSPRAGSILLQDAIDAMNAKDLAAKNQALAEVERANVAKIREAELAAVEQSGRDKVKTVEANSAKERLENENKIKRAELIVRAKSDETRKLLSYYFAPGYVQPGRTQTAEKGPISYSKLLGQGCLDPSPEGLRELLLVVTCTDDKVRPIWTNSVSYVELLPEARRTTLSQMQKALIELGPTLVELELLSP